MRSLFHSLRIIYSKPVKKSSFVILVYIILSGLSLFLEIYLPLKLGNVIDAAIGKEFDRVVKVLMQVFFLYLALSVVAYFKNTITIKISTKMSEDIKNTMIKAILMMPMKDIDLLESGQCISKLGDAELITGFFLSLLNNLFMNILSVIITAIIIFQISPMLALIHYINIPMLYIVFGLFGKLIKKKEKIMVTSRDEMNNFVFGMLQGIREIKTLGANKNVLKRFYSIHGNYVEKQYKKGETSIVLGSCNTVLSGISQIVFLLIACIEIIRGRLSLGMYYAFNSYASRFSSTLSVFSNMSIELQTVSVAVERIVGYYKYNNDVIDNKITIGTIKKITIENICFQYRCGVPIIKDMSYEFDNGLVYVIVGSNGSGKSTLLNLIINFYSPYMGRIMVNNINVKQIKEKSLFSKIAYIRQNPFFFNMSIIDNMKIVDEDISTDKIKKVCEIVGLNDFIQHLPDGYDTIMGDSGSRFSGGQIHRLALARSLILDAEVYILDEITADLDGENEKIIMGILTKLANSGKMVIMVSHRLSTVIRADHIIVMDNGEIVASGTHQMLINNCEMYKKLYGSEWEAYREYINIET